MFNQLGPGAPYINVVIDVVTAEVASRVWGASSAFLRGDDSDRSSAGYDGKHSERTADESAWAER